MTSMNAENEVSSGSRMVVTAKEKERVILLAAAVDGDGREDATTEESLQELGELADTAGAVVVGTCIQNREAVHPGTYIGKGKIEEVRAMIAALQADAVIADDELSPAQMRNLEDALDCKVLDRTMVILDIFAGRASTSEGKIQVELAQLRYQATRLAGSRTYLSRLGGGIGTRGPGEKKLEVDKRVIRDRISHLKRELEQVRSSRETTRKQRMEQGIPVVALVGYTNTGKSTLLNTLTGAGVLEEDQLFATLDPTTRSRKLASGQEVLLTDTVGFIRKLPHHLVEAFRSTLEEAKYADLILHVVDASNPNCYIQMHTVYETLENLGVKDKPVLTAFNKQDLADSEEVCKDLRADRTVKISAKTGQGLEELLDSIEELLRAQKVLIEYVFPYQKAGLIQDIRKFGQLEAEEYTADGIYIKAFVPKEIYDKVMARL